MAPLDIWSIIEPILPPFFGALVGSRYKKEATRRERVIGMVTSVAAGYYLGAMVGAYFTLPALVTMGLMFSFGALGTEIIAYAFTVLRNSPQVHIREWIDAILGRK